ncbi:hypothetical protein BGI41_06335 [Methanobrevibacter sp. 87.7]|uniref:hypothetical protein n=1 Tax=Methanobrevibacter sp. 87.7 TaxID=387957 RepID=UPI000B500CC3|nr:hypothetical protein [Methanobrevibacter sp. 87.7]OWT32693.1 hypothetical protein BGI41_06335 [Methanobrevibacter sp. 87.7]
MKRMHANILVLVIIALIAFGVAGICASFTGSYVNPYLPKMEHKSEKLNVISEGNFTPEQIKTVKEVKKTPTVNKTVNNTTIVKNESKDNKSANTNNSNNNNNHNGNNQSAAGSPQFEDFDY